MPGQDLEDHLVGLTERVSAVPVGHVEGSSQVASTSSGTPSSVFISGCFGGNPNAFWWPARSIDTNREAILAHGPQRTVTQWRRLEPSLLVFRQAAHDEALDVVALVDHDDGAVRRAGQLLRQAGQLLEIVQRTLCPGRNVRAGEPAQGPGFRIAPVES